MAKELSKSKLAFWLVAIGFSLSAGRAAEPSLASPKAAQEMAEPADHAGRFPSAEATEVPKPGPANPKELAAAFSKPIPSSIADLKNMEKRVKELVRRLSPAVVDVQVGNGSGSGVVITEDGLVLTAGHVSGRAGREVRLTFPDGKTAKGTTLGVSRDNDAGLIRITDKGTWPHATVGDLEQAHSGDWVLAMGHPGGFDLKRSLVVRLGRLIRLEDGALRTDCTISPGDSGGPLFDMYGRVIGIHSFISGSLTANFHVPITGFYDDWEQLVKVQMTNDNDP